MFGLSDKVIKYIQVALMYTPEIEEAIIFGSRVMGNYKPGSDIDIAIKGKDIKEDTLFRFKDLVNEEYPIPYYFDVLEYDKIKNENLKKHIDEYGVKLNKFWE